MARENLMNFHIYGEKTDFIHKYIQFLAVSPKINGEYLLITTDLAEARAFAKVYRSEHPDITAMEDEGRKVRKTKDMYFHLLFRECNKLKLKTIVKY